MERSVELLLLSFSYSIEMNIIFSVAYLIFLHSNGLVHTEQFNFAHFSCNLKPWKE